MFSNLRKLLLLILGIPFVMLGTRFLLDAAETAHIHSASAVWTQSEAMIADAVRFSGEDQALGNQTVIRYHYGAGGANRDGQYSCIGDECPRPDLYEWLSAAKNESRAVPVLINPDNPAESLLFRHMHMPMILLKLGVGLFCLLTGSAAVIFGVYLLRGGNVLSTKDKQ